MARNLFLLNEDETANADYIPVLDKKNLEENDLTDEKAEDIEWDESK